MLYIKLKYLYVSICTLYNQIYVRISNKLQTITNEIHK